MGEATARLLHEAGARVVAITRCRRRRSDPAGLDVPYLRRHLPGARHDRRGSRDRPITNEELFALDVDMLVLAAMEGQITADNAGTVRARILAEAANGPVSPSADPILVRNGVAVAARHPVQCRSA